MNKNIIIGVIAVVVLGGVVAYAMKNNTAETMLPDTTNGTSSGTPVNNPAALTPAAPVVTTDPVISPTASTAVVSGKVYPHGATTSYWFEYGTTPEGTSRTAAQVIGSGYVNIPTPAYITGLSSNTKYYFRLVAENSLGKVLGIQYAFQTTLANPPVQGNAPTTKTLAATGIDRTVANLNGSVNPNGSQTSFWFEYGDSTNLGSVSAFQSASGSANNNVSISISGLKPLTKYHFRMNAQNQYGTVNGSILNFITTGPASASKPTVNTTNATKIETSTATLNGRISPNGADTSYWFEYGTDSTLGRLIGTTTVITPIPGNETSRTVSADITNLGRNTRYYFRLVGQNSQGTVKGDSEDFRTKQ